MADMFISEPGAGLKDGSSLANAKDYASVIGADFLSPTVGVEYVRLVGEFTVSFSVQQNGTSLTEKILIDCDTYAATFSGGVSTQAWSFNDKDFIEVIGGTFTGGTDRCVDFFRSSGCVMKTPVITYNLNKPPVRFWCDTADVTDSYIEDGVITNAVGSVDASVRFEHSGNVAHTSKYKRCGMIGGSVTERPKILFSDIPNQIYVNNRRPEGMFFTDVLITGTEQTAIQTGFSDATVRSLLSGVQFVTNGTGGSGLNNCIQTNSELGLDIEDCLIDNFRNPNSTGGDGDGVIVDWEDSQGNYSEDVCVRRNKINDVAEPLATAAAGIGLWAAKRTIVEHNLLTSCNTGVSNSNGISGKDAPITDTTIANPTEITYTVNDSREVQTGDRVNIRNITGGTYSPGINGQHIATRTGTNTFTVPVNCTVKGSFTSAEVYDIQRTTDNVIRCNTIDNCDTGYRDRFGGLGAVWQNSIITNCDYGIRNTGDNLAELGVESYNCFFNNAIGNYTDDAAEQSLDASSMIADPQYINAAGGDFNLKATSPCVGVGMPKWWGNDPRPTSLSGEPVPDIYADIGAYQSLHHARHPNNL